jgi:DNA-binding NarL/FixJ family response regulator
MAGVTEVTDVTDGSRPVKVLVVDDDALVRAGLRMILAAAEEVTVVAEVTDGAEVVAAVDRYRPDVVLMDIRMPRLDGLAATELLRTRPAPPEVIILTTFDTDEHILRAMRAGASGFLLKHAPPPEIVRSIRQVAAGEPMLSPAVTRKLMSYVAGADPARHRARAALGRLAAGELAVARLVAQGRTNSEIGQELMLSVATVKAYVSRVLTKLELNNRVQVALLVHDAGAD